MSLGRGPRQLRVSRPSVGKKWAGPCGVSWEFHFGSKDGKISGSWSWKNASELMWGCWKGPGLPGMARPRTLRGSSNSDKRSCHEIEENTPDFKWEESKHSERSCVVLMADRGSQGRLYCKFSGQVVHCFPPWLFAVMFSWLYCLHSKALTYTEHRTDGALFPLWGLASFCSWYLTVSLVVYDMNLTNFWGTLFTPRTPFYAVFFWWL